MFNLMKKYSETNLEKFNKEFIYSRDEIDILSYIKDIFSALEIIDEIKVEEITLDQDESSFLPIINQRKYYKSITPSRLNKVHYKIKILNIDSSKVVEQEERPILSDSKEEQERAKEIREKITKSEKDKIFEYYEGDIFLNKLIDECFYINEGVRYFLIYQIVDNATYGNKENVSLKSLLMPITVTESITEAVTPEFGKPVIENVPNYDVLLFAKKINPLFYILGKNAYNLLIKNPIKDKDNVLVERMNFKSDEIIKLLNDFFSIDFKFANDLDSLIEKGRLVFSTGNVKNSKEKSLFISVDEKKILERDRLTLAVLGCFLNLKSESRKKTKINFSYNNLITPWFWIERLASFFTKSSDGIRKFEKVKTTLISLERLMDDATKKILKIKKEDKENTLTIIRYIMREFAELSTNAGLNLDDKRIRLFEYQLYPLRKFFSDQIYRILNSTTHSFNILRRIFSNLNPMYIIKRTVTNELLRYYNATNEINLYTCLLKYTFRGPQSINKQATIYQRDLDPSFSGRLSLVASSLSDPGTSGTLVPFVETYDYYFTEQKEED